MIAHQSLTVMYARSKFCFSITPPILGAHPKLILFRDLGLDDVRDLLGADLAFEDAFQNRQYY
jgi:hypothetical protein